jgi:Kdo2-lipid IVA lauroyltransferase/acyltransferase
MQPVEISEGRDRRRAQRMDRQKISLRYRLEFWAFRATAACIGALPLETASTLSGKLWRYIAPFLKRHRRALAHLALAFPEKTPAEHRAIARDMWENLGRVYAESFHLEEIAETERVHFDQHPPPQEVLPLDMCFIACAPHLGNWEVGAAALLRIGGNPAGIYQRIKNPLVNDAVLAMRAPSYPGGLFAKKANAGKQTFRHLKAGGALVTMADLRDHAGPAVPFFGYDAQSTPFPAMAARSLGVPLFACMMARTPRDGRNVEFTVTLRQIDVPHTADREADARIATAALQAAFEGFVRQHPGQWMWAHRRWGRSLPKRQDHGDRQAPAP